MLRKINSIALRIAKKSALVNGMYHALKHLLKKYPKIDFDFPNVIQIEVASVCNLKCTHCPSHRTGHTSPRKFGMLSMEHFERIMAQVDSHGKRRIALHKDGEPLLHPQILQILRRVKSRVDHEVYLTTNGQLMSSEVVAAMFDGKIDHVNISIGAFSPQRYKQVRGADLSRVKDNVLQLLESRRVSAWKPSISVQIIDIAAFGMGEEISEFERYWKAMDVAVEVWSELSWGMANEGKLQRWRYPCFSLWDSFVINSDGLVSGCCVDWNQSLILGNIEESSIQEIWKGERLRRFRLDNSRNDFRDMSLCKHCNYWQWQPKIHPSQYPQDLPGVQGEKLLGNQRLAS